MRTIKVQVYTSWEHLYCLGYYHILVKQEIILFNFFRKNVFQNHDLLLFTAKLSSSTAINCKWFRGCTDESVSDRKRQRDEIPIAHLLTKSHEAEQKGNERLFDVQNEKQSLCAHQLDEECVPLISAMGDDVLEDELDFQNEQQPVSCLNEECFPSLTARGDLAQLKGYKGNERNVLEEDPERIPLTVDVHQEDLPEPAFVGGRIAIENNHTNIKHKEREASDSLLEDDNKETSIKFQQKQQESKASQTETAEPPGETLSDLPNEGLQTVPNRDTSKFL